METRPWRKEELATSTETVERKWKGKRKQGLSGRIHCATEKMNEVLDIPLEEGRFAGWGGRMRVQK